MIVQHKQIYKPGPFGGTINTTLCGRMQLTKDGMNSDSQVTCKLCLRKLAKRGTHAAIVSGITHCEGGL